MKQHPTLQQWLAKAVTGLALAFSAVTCWAVPDQILGTFESDLTGYFVWGRGWGGETFVEWDASGSPDGCLSARGLLNSTNSDTPVCIYAVNAGNPWWHPNPPFDISQYKAIEFDIKWNNDPANMPLSEFNNPTGDPAAWSTSGLEIGSLPSASGDNSGYVTLTNMLIPTAAAGAWVHVKVPIDATLPGLTASYGLWIRKWICNPPANPGDWQTGHVITNNGYYQFYLDNVVLKGGDVLPPPTMIAPAPASPGENFIASSAGQWDRQEIRTVATNYSWIGASGPVSYSVDVTKIGDSSAPAILFFHWVPGGANPTRNDSDWHEPSLLMWRIGNNADGSAWSSLHYKTNAPDSNGHNPEDFMYNVGNLGGPGSASYKGTWTISFDGNATVTMTSSDGTSLTTNIPPDVITIFQATPGMQVNIGHVPNSGPTPVGQISAVTRARFTGTPATIDSNFLLAAPDESIWKALPNGASGVKWVPSTAPYWLKWSLPATGFSLQSQAAVGAGTWNDLATWGFDSAGKHHALLAAEDLPSPDAGYYRLIKRAATRLLILLPGETNAPNTLTGKIGTPIVQTNGVAFTVRVLSTSDTFHPVAVNGDYVELTCSGSGVDASGPVTAQAFLNNGVATWNDVYLYASGYTLTATNVTTPTWQTYTTAPITTTP